MERGERVAVCTLVATAGSTPQAPGAMMLVLADGATLGTIGGGCVEAEVRTRALTALAADADAPATLVTFKLDHDLGWDDGLICGGTMRVAIERLETLASAAAFVDARDQLLARQTATLTTRAMDDRGDTQEFTRELLPTPRLVIAGAGHVAAALCPIGRAIGFDVTVVDDRPDMASEARFPGAELRVAPIEAELAGLPINEHTYVAIVTRGHRNDARALAAVVSRPAAYLGLIGSRRKIVAIFEELMRLGVAREALARVHAPIGLDLGAVTPAEIAVSIAAELIAVRRGATLPTASLQLAASILAKLGE